MKLLFIGQAGAGKGTQAVFICERYGIPQISTGDILRAAVKNDLSVSQKAREFMDAGKLVPDEIVIEIVRDRLQEPDAQNGYILDGFPRTVQQADALQVILGKMKHELDAVLNLQVSDEEMLTRLLRRAREQGRTDDTEETIRTRIRTYNEKTRSLLDYYRKAGLLIDIDGMGKIQEVSRNIEAALTAL